MILMSNKNFKNNQNNNVKAPKENKSIAAIKDIANSQNKEKVHFKDYEGHKQVRAITLSDPGIGTATHAMDLMQAGDNTSDFTDLFQLIMDDVIVSPQLSFAKEEKTLPKNLKHKNTNHKNKNGENISLHFAWPGYREAVQIVTEVGRPNGAYNLTGVLNDLNSYVFKDDEGRSVNNNYWNAGGHAYGLGMTAINEAINYLADVLDHDGFNSMIQRGISFLTTALR